MSIQVYNEINEANAATGFDGRTDLPNFFVFTIEDTYPTTRQVMMPYTFNFFQVALLENSSDATLNMNTEIVADLNDSLSFASPEHVLAWIRGEAQRGFIIYFKADFLAQYPIPVQEAFPFFRLTELNVVRVGKSDKAPLKDHFSRLHDMFHSPHPYRVQILQAWLLALLFDGKRLYDEQQQRITQAPAKSILTFRFQQFINQHYLTYKTVEAYAKLLNVSADYLRQSVKAATGKTAHSLVQERVLLEAKKLLTYSDLNVAEIADYLGYAEPTHFGRLFRRSYGVSPLAWRQQNT
ncbi:MAG: helix-turn-helix domain-containing protein [Anaerolineaceae bacterium]|nr:helix-turn-helix domain-containing protein [Anaerolineaceae bacterium]